jgi:hypothetical protein
MNKWAINTLRSFFITDSIKHQEECQIQPILSSSFFPDLLSHLLVPFDFHSAQSLIVFIHGCNPARDETMTWLCFSAQRNIYNTNQALSSQLSAYIRLTR